MRRSDGTLQGWRERLPWPEEKPFRILSIDGGGILGILPAQVLTHLEERYLGGEPIGAYFDLITGTSTGGIIALALSVGKPASEILQLYMLHGPEIFPPLASRFRWLRDKARFIRSVGHYRYERAPLECRLRDIFRTSILGEAERRLCIPSFDGFTEVHIFKTPHHMDFTNDWKDEMMTVALATAAAPTFFPIYRNNGRHFGDGGVWANNPAMIGLVDALSCNDVRPRNVHILSLGCGDREMTMSKGQIRAGGLWHWRDIVRSAMHLQSQNALGQAGLLIGRDQLVRVNAPAPCGDDIEMDDFERARDELPPIARGLADTFGDMIRTRFLFEPSAPYRAYHGPRSAAEISN